ncbi:DUF6573 family protein [Nocardia sp. NPDC059246]|uniref:DUF6573 family protein n=1 Tax=unclassified Nocardia TaxID=2637762 RepID=UPI0036A52485
MPDIPIAYTYSREQAIASGALRDVSDLARQAGFARPVALTEQAWTHAVAWDHDGALGQSTTGRTLVVLTMARPAIEAAYAAMADADPGSTVRAEFSVLRLVNGSTDTKPHPIALAIHYGPGDNGEPVVTIMRARES